jgi:predicted DNA-binding transcriptional regulator YafY
VRRADRLFQLVQLLRARRVVTAARLADELDVSERTIYRDVRDLVRSGVPIAGEAGVGYALPHRFDLPPLMFSREEVEALVLGARIVRSWADPDLARAAGSVLTKVESVLPDRLRGRVDGSVLVAPGYQVPASITAEMGPLRGAIEEQHKVHLDYTRQDRTPSSRVVRPLALYFWGNRWTLAGWCELRDGFRAFRLDRMDRLEVLDQRFEPEPGRSRTTCARSRPTRAEWRARPPRKPSRARACSPSASPDTG